MNAKSNWTAWVDTMPSPTPTKLQLRVQGDIKVKHKPVYSLKKAVPQGINPKILILDVEPSRPELGDIDTHLEYTEAIGSADQYTEVQIREIVDRTVEVRIVS